MSSNSSPINAYTNQSVPSQDFYHSPAAAYANHPVPSQYDSTYSTLAVINEPHQIYLVQHRTTGKICVKKILGVYNINIYARLYHDHITGTPEIISYQETDGKLTVIEEYVAGTSLQEKITEGILTEIDILSYMIDVCSILEQLHGFMPPIVHRDIKPSNVIITEYNRAVLLDFNAAKYYSAGSSEDTVLLGTQGYASPEQYGFGASSPQSDIYSLGVMLKEMMSSVQLSNLELTTIANKCSQMIPADRFATVTVLKKRLIRNLKKVLRRYDSHVTRVSNINRSATTTSGKTFTKSINSSPPSALVPNNTAETLRITNARNLVAKRFDLNLPDLHDYALPGFRTGTPHNIMIAAVSYSLMAFLSTASTVSNARSFCELWAYRIATFVMMMMIVFTIFNYRNIWRFMPLCKSKNPIIQAVGIAILTLLVLIICLCLFYVIIEIIFS